MGRDDKDLAADRLVDEDALILAEAELVAISEGEPEVAAILADELARRRRSS